MHSSGGMAAIDMLSACGRGDLRAVRHLVEAKGVRPATAIDSIAQNGLHYVAGSPDVDIEKQVLVARFLVSVADTDSDGAKKSANGVEVNAARVSDGWTPIFLAVAFNKPSLVSALLQVRMQQTASSADRGARVALRGPRLDCFSLVIKIKNFAIVHVMR
jgi:ankyrin repeat protein